MKIYKQTEIDELANILNKEKIMVNSVHHDYVDFSMKNLMVSASSSDNIIEAVELPNHPFLIGLQWHPELMKNDSILLYFSSYLKVCSQSMNFKEINHCISI